MVALVHDSSENIRFQRNKIGAMRKKIFHHTT